MAAAAPAGAVDWRALHKLSSVDTERRAAVLRCASCHADTHKAWEAGPHASAYRSIWKQLELAEAPDSPVAKAPREESLKADLRKACMACHAPTQNVYDGALPVRWDPENLPPVKIMEIPADRLPVNTGVDCLTCHAQGERVVTRQDYRRAEDFTPPEGFCDPLPSTTFSHIFNCVNCHEAAVLDYAKRFQLDAGRREDPYRSCNHCHMEKDESGRPTHYYYWEGDFAKKIAAMIHPLLDTIKFGVGGAGGERALTFEWDLGGLPHPLIPNTPQAYVLTFEVGAKGKKAEFTQVVRLHSKLNDEQRKTVRERNPTGELIVSRKGQRLSKRYPLPAGISGSGTVRLTVHKKRMLGYPDELSRKVFEKRLPYGG